MRACIEVEELRKEREALIVSEIPYQVNKATLIEKIAELVRDKRIEGISDLRDESDRDGMRIVIELKRDAVAEVVLNQLWRYTALQSSFGANMIALNGGRPEMLNLKDFLRAFLDFREEVVTRRTKFLLGKARDSAHLQVGLAIAVANIDEVIRLIRTSPDAAAARAALMERAWPARDMAPLVALIADPRHALDRGRQLPPVGSAGARDPRSPAAAPDRARTRGNRRGAEQARRRDQRLSRHPALARARLCDHPGRAGGGEGEFCDAAAHEIVEAASDMEDEDLIQREDMVVTVSHARLCQARAAVDLPCAAPRRQGPLGHADARGGFRRARLRRFDASAGAVLLLARPSLQGEGVAPAAGRAECARQGARQYPAARAGRADHDDHGLARRRGGLGHARRDVRDDARLGAGATSSPISRRSTAPARSP